MRRLFVPVLFLFLSACASTQRPQPPADGSADTRLRVAVLDVANRTGDPLYDPAAASAAALLGADLQGTGAFRLVERQRLDAVLGELKLGMSGLVDPAAVRAVGRQVGVDAFVVAELSSVSCAASKQTMFILWTEGCRTDIVMNARLVEVETGEIRATAQSAGTAKRRTWVAFWVAKLGSLGDKAAIAQTGVEQGCRTLAAKLAQAVGAAR